MESSESINELSAALAKAQAEMKAAPKDSVNPHFRSKFANLATCMEAAKPLAKHGLAIIQATHLTPDGFQLVTRLAHSSGQWVQARWPLPSQGKPQELGSALTYARRYTLALFGLVTDEDDDAEAAHGRGSAQSFRVDPRPEGTDQQDPEIVEQYADAIRTQMNANNPDGVFHLHVELNKDPPLYAAVGGKLNTKEKNKLREIVASKRQAA